MIMRDMFEMYYTLGLYNGLTEEDAHSYATEMVELFKQELLRQRGVREYHDRPERKTFIQTK